MRRYNEPKHNKNDTSKKKSSQWCLERYNRHLVKRTKNKNKKHGHSSTQLSTSSEESETLIDIKNKTLKII